MLNRLALNGTWELAGFEEGRGDWSKVEAPYPIAAPVPGEVHPALQAAGIIQDPNWGMNAKQCMWVEEKEWWYRRTFTLPPGFMRSQTFLEFEGLDTFATVLINGNLAGASDNMSIPHRFDITGKLKENEDNVLEVRFTPVMSVISKMDLSRYQARYGKDRLGARKLQASFGWDWMPRLLGAGIWRDVQLVSYDQLSIRDLYIKPSIEGRKGIADIAIEVENHTGMAAQAVMTVMVSRGRKLVREEVHREIPAAGVIVRLPITVSDPQLWWPNGLGEAALYSASVELRIGGEMLDACERKFGFRTMELHEHDDSGNPAFFFKINGMPVYIKGANWIPCDAFPSRVDSDKYESLLTLARNAHFNTLRVWGGGIYEKQEFYDICDEMGIMVWQDFMFSLGEYPDDPEFIHNVAAETHGIVRSLRNHPCLLLWCGNNECELQTKANASWPGKSLFHDVIPRIVNELDGSRPYWPSSPYGGSVGRSPDYGDYHGEPWFKIIESGADTKWDYIESDRGLFMSEFPTQGPPEVETLRRFIPEEDISYFDEEVWEFHNQNNNHRQGIIHMTSQQALIKNITDFMGAPENVEQFAYMGGVLQGEFLKDQIGYYRRHKFGVGGSLVWDFDDAWPAVAYSLVDYYLRPKPAYYYVKRVFAPVGFVLAPCEDGIAAWAINDLAEPVAGTALIYFMDLVRDITEIQELQFDVPANQARQIWTTFALADPRSQILAGKLEIDGLEASRASYYAAMFRDIEFPQPSIQVDKSFDNGILTLTLTSDAFAHAVRVANLPDTARPDDNYIDLLPLEARQITIPGLTKSQAERVRIEPLITKAAKKV